MRIMVLVIVVHLVDACGPGRGIGGQRRGRKLTPLVFKEHVPNVSENTLGASGLPEGAITRDDDRFRDLVPNYNRDIIFKDDEGTGADRLMTQRCKEKLNTLAWSVMNQWPGVRLRVTEAWAEERLHGHESLHYEGRAVDITTSDKDKSKYGMLARLAVEAGFDWVFYESRGYIHCSVKSDSSQASYTSGCFTASSTVVTQSGERRRLADLRIGERVLSIDSESGRPVFSEVMLFLDRNADEERQFMQIEAEAGTHLTVTPSHLLMSVNSVGRRSFVFADRVEEGDLLLVAVNGTTLVPRRVTRVSVTLSRGVFAPLTRAGTIIVDSVAASCYALVDSQAVAHWSFLPVRAAKTISRWFSPAQEPEASRQNGIHWYAKALYAIKDYMLPAKLLHQH
ncbi:protein hedgehog [Phlebotomus argentipes]|uniref:protein hedgehog n=1 Tax=Phlebotomus argentipes TaxID=94469 RepID=UPI00289356BF|nr:protein hedgehog [Phlebotomus argentipes]